MARGRYVFSSQEHRPNGMRRSPCRCTSPSCSRAFLPGRSEGTTGGARSVFPAIPLTRLRIIVLAREETRGRRRVSVSALISVEDFGACERSNASEREKERRMQRDQNSIARRGETHRREERKGERERWFGVRIEGMRVPSGSLIQRRAVNDQLYRLPWIFDGTL